MRAACQCADTALVRLARPRKRMTNLTCSCTPSKHFWSGLLLAMVSFCEVAQAASLWDQFLDRPQSWPNSMLHRKISVTHLKCDHAIAPSSLQIARLLRLIDSGNDFGFRAAIEIAPCLGVGDQEDVYRSAGTYFEIRPHDFLQVLLEQRLQDRTLEDLITMLPLTKDESMSFRIRRLTARLRILDRYGGSKRSALVTKLAKFLEDEIADVRRVMPESGDNRIRS